MSSRWNWFTIDQMKKRPIFVSDIFPAELATKTGGPTVYL